MTALSSPPPAMVRPSSAIALGPVAWRKVGTIRRWTVLVRKWGRAGGWPAFGGWLAGGQSVVGRRSGHGWSRRTARLELPGWPRSRYAVLRRSSDAEVADVVPLLLLRSGGLWRGGVGSERLTSSERCLVGSDPSARLGAPRLSSCPQLSSLHPHFSLDAFSDAHFSVEAIAHCAPRVMGLAGSVRLLSALRIISIQLLMARSARSLSELGKTGCILPSTKASP